MNPEEKAIKLATGPQCATIGQMVAVALTKKFDGQLTFSQAQIAITGKKQFDVNLLAEKFAKEIFGISINPWIEETKKISYFYKTCFKDPKWKNPNWEQVIIPTAEGKFQRPEFIFIETMNEDDAFDAYALFFGKDKTWKAYKKITKAIDHTTIQLRPAKNYAMLHVGGDEPDLFDYSYDDGISKKLLFMTPLEGIISAFRYRFETGKMYDVKGITRFSALDGDGYAMSMCGGDDDGFRIDGDFRDGRSPDSGLREVAF